ERDYGCVSCVRELETFIYAIQFSWSLSSIITTIESLSLPHHRMKNERIAKVELLVCGVGFVMKVIGNRSQLMNFVSKFLGTVRFENDQVAKIMGYGDYQQGNKKSCFIRNLEGVDLLSGSRDTNCISHQTSVTRTPQQNNVVERRNLTLVEAARTMLIFSKAHLFLRAEPINTACYTQNCSLIRLRYNKTPYELMHDKKPDLSFFHVFGSLCYPTNDSEDLGKLNANADIGIFVRYAPTKKPDLSFFHVFGSLYYPTNDSEDLGKLNANANIGIFVRYAPAKKAFRIYNRRTRKIIETIHVMFDELTTMASEQFGSGP
nr:hypothetical protein [Tanacetum cinerariifolium]